MRNGTSGRRSSVDLLGPAAILCGKQLSKPYPIASGRVKSYAKMDYRIQPNIRFFSNNLAYDNSGIEIKNMVDYIFLMHNDASGAESDLAWERYLEKLRSSGQFQGGSSIGNGECVSRGKQVASITSHLSGFIRVQAETLEAAKDLLVGNPVFEAGGTVEIRELPRE